MAADEAQFPLRVCHMIGHVNIGGAERQVVNLVNALGGLGPVLLLTDPHGDDDLLGSVDPRVRIVRSPCRRSRLPADVLQLARRLRELQIDVLHTHMFWPSLYGAVAARLARIPVMVTTEHGMNPWKRRWHRWCERHLISGIARRRICVSEDILQNRLLRDGLPRDQLMVLPNGTAMRPVAAKAVPERPRLFAAGRLVLPKDFDNLLTAMRLLLDGGLEATLAIAGEGPMRSSLETRIRELRLERHVTLLGSRQDVPALMDASDIFVISSSREGQPLALLEAMASSMPIVSTEVGGIPHTVESGKEALLVPPGRPDLLAKGMERLIREPALAEALGRRARQRAADQFSITAVADMHLRLYRQLLRRENNTA